MGTNTSIKHWVCAGAIAACLAVLAGCATPQAAEPRGKWRPVHQFSAVPQAIPLQQAYLFQAFPSDQTLKALLTRWSSDAGLNLSYRLTSDYTLHAPVALLRTTSIEQAAATLTEAYAAQGVQVTAELRTIVVAQAPPVQSDAAGTTD